jgi:hypothetical protein
VNNGILSGHQNGFGSFGNAKISSSSIHNFSNKNVNGNQGMGQTAQPGFYGGNSEPKKTKDDIGKLKSIIAKLERKSEDRKLSLKQLFTILTIKEKELSKWQELCKQVKQVFQKKTMDVIFNLNCTKNSFDDKFRSQEKKLSSVTEKLNVLRIIREREVNSQRRCKLVEEKGSLDTKKKHDVELEKLRQKLAILEKENRKLFSTNENNLNSLEKENGLLCEKDDEISNLMYQIDRLNSDFGKTKEKLEKEVSKFKQKLDEERKRVAELEKFRDLHSNALETLEHSESGKIKLQQKLDSLGKTNSDEKSRSQLLEKEKTKCEDQLATSLSVIEQSERDKKIKSREFEISLNELKNRCDKYQKEFDFIKEENDILDNKICGKELEISELNKKRLKSEKDAKDAEVRVGSLENDKKWILKEKEDLEKYLDEISTKNKMQDLELRGFRADNEILGKKFQNSTTDSQNLDAKVQALE